MWTIPVPLHSLQLGVFMVIEYQIPAQKSIPSLCYTESMYEPGTAEGDTPKTRRWRTMFHVIYIGNQGVWMRIPAWSSWIAVMIPWDQIAPELRANMQVDNRYHGLACIGCNSYMELNAFINEN